jgi:hypothetical protein
MTQPVWPINSVESMPPPEMVIRSRHDLSTRDAANARNFELWQTDGKHGVYNRPDMNAQAPFHEFLPINSRSETRRYHPQPRFTEDGHRGGMNPYFDKYDTAYDARNMVRELQAVVYEDNPYEYIPQSRALVERGVEHRWIPPSDWTQTADRMSSTHTMIASARGGARADTSCPTTSQWRGMTDRMSCDASLVGAEWARESGQHAEAAVQLRPAQDDIRHSYR